MGDARGWLTSDNTGLETFGGEDAAPTMAQRCAMRSPMQEHAEASPVQSWPTGQRDA